MAQCPRRISGFDEFGDPIDFPENEIATPWDDVFPPSEEGERIIAGWDSEGNPIKIPESQLLQEQEWNEVEREVTLVMIEDPDSVASIEVERIDSITFETESGRRMTLNMDWTE